MNLNKVRIAHLGLKNAIEPTQKGKGINSCSMDSYAYDIRFTPADFRIVVDIPGKAVNPMEVLTVVNDQDGSFFVLPPHTYALGVGVKEVALPRNARGILIGVTDCKQCETTLTRVQVGIGWRTHLVELAWYHLMLEIFNESDTDCRIYINQGIIQLILFEEEGYKAFPSNRNEKYQNQTTGVLC